MNYIQSKGAYLNPQLLRKGSRTRVHFLFVLCSSLLAARFGCAVIYSKVPWSMIFMHWSGYEIIAFCEKTVSQILGFVYLISDIKECPPWL